MSSRASWNRSDRGPHRNLRPNGRGGAMPGTDGSATRGNALGGHVSSALPQTQSRAGDNALRRPGPRWLQKNTGPRSGPVGLSTASTMELD